MPGSASTGSNAQLCVSLPISISISISVLVALEWKPWNVPEGHKLKLVVHDEPVPIEKEETK